LSHGRATHARASRLGDLGRGLSALFGVALLAAGIPLALVVVVGWPLPHAVPSPADLRQALTSGSIPDEFYGKALAVLAWLYWGHFMVCLGAEVAAARKGRVARHVPLAGLNQAIAARLIGAILLLTPSSPGLLRPVPAMSATRPTPAAVAAVATTADTARQAPQRLRPERPAAARPVYVVQAKQPGKPRDTLWGIAERFLGDPRRWPEVFALNKGDELPDPPGGHFNDPNLIYPGQALKLPPDATGLPAARQGPAAATRRPPDRPDRDQEDQRDRHPRPTAPPAAAAGETPTTTASPATTPSSSAAAPSTTAAPPALAPDRPPPTPAPLGEQPHGQADDAVAVPIAAAALAIGGLLAVGVVATLARLRRRQQRYRQPGRRIRLPVGRTAHVEEQLRAAAEPEWARFLDAALRAMAAGLRRTGLATPIVQAVLLGPTDLEVLLEEPTEAAPPPFTLGADGRRWTLPCHIPVAQLEAIGEDAVAPLPGLVTLGFSDAGQLMLNLEAPGLTALVGGPAVTRPLLDAMAVELATAASSGFVQVLLVGFGPELDRLERVHRVEHLDDVLPDLERQAQEAAALVDEAQVGSVLGGRIAGEGADSWSPTVVLVAQPSSPASLERLATVTADPHRSTVAAVLVGDAAQAGWHLEVGDDQVRVPALELAVHPQRLTGEDYTAIGDLLSTAGDLDGVEPTAAPYDQLQPTMPAQPVAGMVADLQAAKAAGARLAAATFAGGAEAAAAAVEVRVLGRVELHGAGKIERAKAIELIIYLALHPQGVDSERLWEALWPEKGLNRGTLHTTVTAARTGLGRAPDGARYLPDARDGLYRLSEAVGLDWARFQTLAAQGQRGDHGSIQALHEALELVRGLPLESPASRSYDWAVVHRTEMETVIAETAERLGLLYLDAGDPEQANWAARRGLAASPYDERLYRLLMRSAHAAGNPAGVEAIWQELLAVLGADLELVDEDLHPETVALYTTLRPSGRTRAGQAGAGGRRPAVSSN
jgi:DNA-binding SARP family transcriptional activator